MIILKIIHSATMKINNLSYLINTFLDFMAN